MKEFRVSMPAFLTSRISSTREEIHLSGKTKNLQQRFTSFNDDKVCHQVWSTYFEQALSLSLFGPRKSRPNFSCRDFQVYGATKKRHRYTRSTHLSRSTAAKRRVSKNLGFIVEKCRIKGDAAAKNAASGQNIKETS